MLTDGIISDPGNGFLGGGRLLLPFGTPVGVCAAAFGTRTSSKGRFGKRVIGFVCPLGSFTRTVLPMRVCWFDVPSEK